VRLGVRPRKATENTLAIEALQLLLGVTVSVSVDRDSTYVAVGPDRASE